MIHDLDLLTYLDGTRPVSVDAVGVNALTDKIDIANARIRLESGCVANLTASRISAEPSRRIRVFQERSYLSCDTGARSVERYSLQLGEGGAPKIVHDHLKVDEGEPLRLELEEFLQSVRTRKPPLVDGAQGKLAIEMAARVLESIGTGKPLGGV
jgi:predicted dehydrogenase